LGRHLILLCLDYQRERPPALTLNLLGASCAAAIGNGPASPRCETESRRDPPALLDIDPADELIGVDNAARFSRFRRENGPSAL